MILERDKIFKRIMRHKFSQTAPVRGLAERVEELARAIDSSVKELGKQIMVHEPQVHLAYSGGLDSTLVLHLLRKSGFPVIAHTLTATSEHPDVRYARQYIQQQGRGIGHRIHLITPTPEDVTASNRLLGKEANRPDNYYLLFKVISQDTDRVLCCDCVDELLGGYYRHQRASDRCEALAAFMSQLIPNHLEALDQCSTFFGVQVGLPYASQAVLNAASQFSVNELVDGTGRKKPLCAVAAKEGIPDFIIQRRKYGLVQAMSVKES